MVVNIIAKYCYTCVLLYAKMLKETKTKETIDVFVTFLSLMSFQLRRRGQGPLATPMTVPISASLYPCKRVSFEECHKGGDPLATLRPI